MLSRLCAHTEHGQYRDKVVNWLEDATGIRLDPALQDSYGRDLNQSIIMLRHSFRFDDRSGIGQLAHAINAGDRHAALDVLKSDTFSEVQWIPLRRDDERRLLSQSLRGRQQENAWSYRYYLHAIRPQPETPGTKHLEHEDPLVRRPTLEADREAWDYWAAAISRPIPSFSF